MDLLVGGAAAALLELVDPVAGEAGVRVAVDQAGHRDEACRVDDDRAVIQVELVADLVAVADGDDLARVGGDPHVALVYLDVAEGAAPEGLAGLTAGRHELVRRQTRGLRRCVPGCSLTA